MAVRRGDFPDAEAEAGKVAEPGKGWTVRRTFWECFKGNSTSKAHADFWLNWLIGFSEIAAYPVLLKTGYLSAIGGWLLLRTAGSWGGWKVSRTSFNRFLLCIILELAISYFMMAHYVFLIQGNFK